MPASAPLYTSMPVLLLCALALTVGIAVGAVAWRYPRMASTATPPAVDAARKVGEVIGTRRRLRAGCGIAFGGRILRFGAGAEVAARYSLPPDAPKTTAMRFAS